MPDPFIDRLYEQLVAEHTGGHSGPPTSDDGDAAAIQTWWAQFADVLGQKVGAWNEKRPSAAPVHFTTLGRDRVRIEHTAVDVELRLEHNQVLARSPARGDQRDEQPIFRLDVAGTGNVVAHPNEAAPLTTATAAAEMVIGPMLTRVFEDLR